MEKEHTWIKIRAQLPCFSPRCAVANSSEQYHYSCHWRRWSQIGSEQQRTVMVCTAVRFTTALAALRREHRRVVDGEAATLLIRTIEGMFMPRLQRHRITVALTALSVTAPLPTRR